MMNPCKTHTAHPNVTATPANNISHRALSSHALDALEEFYADRDARAKQFEELQAEAEEKAAAGGVGAKQPLSMEAFNEDWNESQFWVVFCSQISPGKFHDNWNDN